MLNCRQVSRLVSRSMDEKLAWHERLAVRFHLLYCVWCRRYTSQIQFLRKAAKGLSPDEFHGAKLSEEAKEQMRQRLTEAQNESPSSPPR
jgi:Putative zinc-finger